MDFSSITFVDLIGYLASAFVLGAFFMDEVKKIRIINSIGCIFFVYYGYLLDKDLPIILTNSSIFILNSYYVFIKKRKRK